ncbi:hypothetical protein [Algiphilus sp.]|uniref:hypothetical protein n=1 Tax=Algiphilus sp. TaxID=1872431 RepID=UPI003C470C16
MKGAAIMALALMAALGTPAIAADDAGPAAGSTIVGDQESAIGLFLMPWREDPASDMDRPPRRLPLAPDVGAVDDTRARVEIHETVDLFRRTQLERR